MPPYGPQIEKDIHPSCLWYAPFCSLYFLRAESLEFSLGGSLAQLLRCSFASSSSSATSPHVFYNPSCLLLQPPPHSTPPFRNTRCNTGKWLMSLCSRTRLIVRNASSTPSSPPCQLCQPAALLPPCLRIHFDAAFQFSQNPSFAHLTADPVCICLISCMHQGPLSRSRPVEDPSGAQGHPQSAPRYRGPAETALCQVQEDALCPQCHGCR